MTNYWVRYGRSPVVRQWMVSAWVMLAADVVFAVRSAVPPWFGQTVPNLLVTLGQGWLYFSAQNLTGSKIQGRLVSAVVFLHAVGLTLFFVLNGSPMWRMTMNAAIWCALSLGSAWWLRRAAPNYWKSTVAPATVFVAHAAFHAVRVVGSASFQVLGWTECFQWLQLISSLEVSFFMVGLYLSLLMADLLHRNDELKRALAEVQTLSGLLPICAWCKSIRNDSGYWQKLEDYLSSRSQLVFTHSMCPSCAKSHFPKVMGDAQADSGT